MTIMPYDTSSLIFLSTLSLRRATYLGAGKSCNVCYFYPRSPCGERPLLSLPFRAVRIISIHALLAESDVWPGLLARPFFIISIHALLAESDELDTLASKPPFEFLSTLSLRRATYDGLIASANFCNFYPRSPCGERLYMGVTVLGIQHISIHALLAESDRQRR